MNIFYFCFSGLREEEPGSSTLLYRSVRLILVASLTIHFTGCVWYGIACTRYDDAGFNVNLCNKDSWIFSLPHCKMNLYFAKKDVYLI